MTIKTQDTINLTLKDLSELIREALASRSIIYEQDKPAINFTILYDSDNKSPYVAGAIITNEHTISK
jgi:hypothetical protein